MPTGPTTALSSRANGRRSEPEALISATVAALAGTLGLRDGDTGSHCGCVGDLSRRIGRRLGLSEPAVRELVFAAELHDIGKVGVPDAVLHKPGQLTAEEWQVIRSHSTWGAELVARIPGLERVARIVRHHHERYDGGGYPDGLAGEDIPIDSRILSAVDAYAAMTEARPYRAALDEDAARRELLSQRGAQFDPDVVDALVLELRSQ
jgi:HD-GYP domain-containing protein (c-di-GMP phosphodiesterase class II)